MVVSALSLVVGAIMYFATTAQSANVVSSGGFRLSTVGVILMIAGAVGFVISGIIFASSRPTSGISHHTLDRQTTNEAGQTTTLHEQKN
jgi:uncharacterized membrane protein YciS (DUF1049 family)